MTPSTATDNGVSADAAADHAPPVDAAAPASTNADAPPVEPVPVTPLKHLEAARARSFARFYRGMWLFWFVVVTLAVGYVFFRAATPYDDIRAASQGGEPPGCFFKAGTGLPCPLCGGTRAAAWAVEGRLERAFLFQPLGPIGFVLALFSIPLAIWGVFRPMPAIRFMKRWLVNRRTVIPVLVAMIAIWIARIAITEEAMIEALDAREAAAQPSEHDNDRDTPDP